MLASFPLRGGFAYCSAVIKHGLCSIVGRARSRPTLDYSSSEELLSAFLELERCFCENPELTKLGLDKVYSSRYLPAHSGQYTCERKESAIKSGLRRGLFPPTAPPVFGFVLEANNRGRRKKLYVFFDSYSQTDSVTPKIGQPRECCRLVIVTAV